MPKHVARVVPPQPPAPFLVRRQPRHPHLVDQLPQKRRLRQQLHVHEFRIRLQRHRLQRLLPMQPTRRMHVHHRYRVNRLPLQPEQPPQQALHEPGFSATVNVVAFVNRRQQGVQMRRGPRLDRRRNQNQRLLALPGHPFQRRAQTFLAASRDHHCLDRPFPALQEIPQPRRHPLGPIRPAGIEDYHEHPRAGPRLPAKVRIERVQLGFIHPAHTGTGASQRSIAVRNAS